MSVSHRVNHAVRQLQPLNLLQFFSVYLGRLVDLLTVLNVYSTLNFLAIVSNFL